MYYLWFDLHAIVQFIVKLKQNIKACSIIFVFYVYKSIFPHHIDCTYFKNKFGYNKHISRCQQAN